MMCGLFIYVIESLILLSLKYGEGRLEVVIGHVADKSSLLFVNLWKLINTGEVMIYHTTSPNSIDGQ